MIVKSFTFNAFQENTYVVSDGSKECIIFDPGCSNPNERKALTDYIKNEGLTPVRLLNTHCHIDHILGNDFVSKEWDLPLEAHAGEVAVLSFSKQAASMYGIAYDDSPPIAKYIEEGDKIEWGQSVLETLFTPGHSPASLSFFHRESKQLIAGDVLFQNSIGRTDLPGGNYDLLIRNIKEKFLPLGDDVIVYSGHGPSTTIGHEKQNNPFLNQ